MKKTKDLENSINYLTSILNKLKTKIHENDEYNLAYNKLLIDRAELRKKLHLAKNNKLLYLIQSNLHYLKPKNKEKLICDYFTINKIRGC